MSFKHLKFCITVSTLVTCYLLLVTVDKSYALNLDKAKVYFLEGDYAGCISECENILAQGQYSKDLDRLYFLLGLSYLKTQDYLRSYDCLEIIIKEFKDSYYKEDATLTQADIYFLKEDFKTALAKYEGILEGYPNSRLKPLIYFRLANAHLKSGSWQEARQYRDRLEKEYPLSFENRMSENLFPTEFYFTVQVGAFSKKSNAQNLCDKLINEGYSAFIQETSSEFGKIYRVRVGKLNSHFEAEELERTLKAIGYSTKIYP